MKKPRVSKIDSLVKSNEYFTKEVSFLSQEVNKMRTELAEMADALTVLITLHKDLKSFNDKFFKS